MGFNDKPRQGGYRDNFNSKPVEKHKAVCSECKKDCEVPFKPTEGKAVFCQECYAKKPKTPRRY
ncbi:MAG: CxxC-x17-CxxC domain-containing protein [Nanoarchaeota archaeon]